jgi:hypothetical protein
LVGVAAYVAMAAIVAVLYPNKPVATV